MRPSHLRLVTAETPTASPTPFARIEAAFEQMMADARRMRIAASSLNRSSRQLFALADQIEEKIPLFADAERRLLVERDRAYEIANDASIVERRILQSGPGNLTPLTAGLPARLQAGIAKAHAA